VSDQGALRDQLARFHGAITGRASLDSARDLVERDRDIDELERLHVYEHAYTARIASVLVHDYPKLAHLVGECELRAWTADYLRAHPPSNFSLREVGEHLARWLDSRSSHVSAETGAVDIRENMTVPVSALRSQKPGTAPISALRSQEPGTAPIAAQLLADLARLERARTEVFDGPDATALAREDLAELDPAEFPSLRLRLVPSSRVVTIESDADEVWDAIENPTTNGDGIDTAPTNDSDGIETAPTNDGDGIESERAAAKQQRVILVWRRDLVVLHRTLESDEARIVPSMIAGTTFGAACELLDEETAAERAIELLVRWLDAQILAR
jgi:hypothetical protein